MQHADDLERAEAQRFVDRIARVALMACAQRRFLPFSRPACRARPRLLRRLSERRAGNLCSACGYDSAPRPIAVRSAGKIPMKRRVVEVDLNNGSRPLPEL